MTHPRLGEYIIGVLVFGVVFIVVSGICALLLFATLPAMNFFGSESDTGDAWFHAGWFVFVRALLAIICGLVAAYFCCRRYFRATPESNRADRMHAMEDSRGMHSPHGHIVEGRVEVAPELYAQVRREHLKWSDKIFGRQDKNAYEEAVEERVAALLPAAYFFGNGIFSIGCEGDMISVAEVAATKTQSALIVGFVPIPTGESARETKIIEWLFPNSTPCLAAISTSGRHHKPSALTLTFGSDGKQVVFKLDLPVIGAGGETSLEEVLAFLSQRMPSFRVQHAT